MSVAADVADTIGRAGIAVKWASIASRVAQRVLICGIGSRRASSVAHSLMEAEGGGAGGAGGEGSAAQAPNCAQRSFGDS